MAIIIYTVSLILLFIISICLGTKQSLKHAAYTSFLFPAVFMAAKRIIKKDLLNYGSKLMFLYGARGNESLYVTHWAIKFSSFILFAGFPVVHLSLATPGYIESMLSCAMPVLGFLLPDVDLSLKIKQKKERIMLAFPIFCTDLAVMSGAGLNITTAWEKAVEKDSSGEFYKEARFVLLKTMTGTLFCDALKVFSANLAMPEIHTFVTIVNQEIKSGSGGMAYKLKDCAKRSWNTRENIARKKGEEAVSKLVFPLAVGLAGILLVLAAPAVMIMKGM